MRLTYKDECGSLLVEAVVGVAILAIALMPMFGSWTVSAGANVQAGQKMAALTIARAQLERLHTRANWDALSSNLTPPASADPDQPAYLVTTTASLRTPSLLDVTVVVSWTDAKGRAQQVSVATSVARRP